MHHGSKLNPWMLLFLSVTDVLFVFLKQEKLECVLMFWNKAAFKTHRIITLLGTYYCNRQIVSIFLQCIPEDSGRKACIVSVPAPSNQLVVAALLLFVSCCFIVQKITYCTCSGIFYIRLQKISLTLLTPCSEIL